MPSEPQECKSEAGGTVGLIDALNSICQVIAQRDLSDPSIQEALADLRSDAAVQSVIKWCY